MAENAESCRIDLGGKMCGNCHQPIEADAENGWVHVESGLAGCGLPFRDEERYAIPVTSTNA